MSELIREGLVEEFGTLPSEGGRPTARLRAASTGACLIGADIGERGVVVELFDLCLQRLDGVVSALSGGVPTPASVAQTLTKAIASVKRSNEDRARGLVGIGLGLPGIVATSPEGATTLFAQNLGWPPVRLTDIYSSSDIPVFADNCVQTLAVAEMWFGAARGVRHGIVVSIGRGIGAGVISEGRLLRGFAGSAGEFGHTKTPFGKRLCECGSYGCLEAYVGGSSILERWREAGGSPKEFDESALLELIALADGRDAAAAAVLDETVGILSLNLANLVNLFNPERIFLGGWAGEPIFEARSEMLEHQIREHSLKRPGEQFHLEACMFRDDKATLGAALLPLEQLIEGNIARPARRSDL